MSIIDEAKTRLKIVSKGGTEALDPKVQISFRTNEWIAEGLDSLANQLALGSRASAARWLVENGLRDVLLALAEEEKG